MESILKFQHDFFEKGLLHLRPLVLRDVAEDIEMSEGTVSRTTTNKYVQTPRGVYSLKFFFSSPIRGCDGNLLSAVSVKEEIKRIIATEDRRKPYSDVNLARLLQAKGINIARRTVAKYREKLGILPSSRRKKQI
jgi:RNA polymerase sigma-54 factor